MSLLSCNYINLVKAMTSEMEDGTAGMCVDKPKAGGIEAVMGVCYGSLTVLGWRKAGTGFAKN